MYGWFCCCGCFLRRGSRSSPLGSGMYAWFCGCSLFTCRFSFVVVRPKMLGRMVGKNQKDSYAATFWPHSSPAGTVACFLLVLLVDAVRVVFPMFVGRLAARCVDRFMRQAVRPRCHAVGYRTVAGTGSWTTPSFSLGSIRNEGYFKTSSCTVGLAQGCIMVHRQRAGFAVDTDTASHVHRH